MFESTRWLCAYCPVRKVARDGQQSANDTTACVKVVPRRASRRLTFRITRIDSSVWSSVMKTTMFARRCSRFCESSAGFAPWVSLSRLPPAPPPEASASAHTPPSTTATRVSLLSVITPGAYFAGRGGVPLLAASHRALERQHSAVVEYCADAQDACGPEAVPGEDDAVRSGAVAGHPAAADEEVDALDRGGIDTRHERTHPRAGASRALLEPVGDADPEARRRAAV